MLRNRIICFNRHQLLHPLYQRLYIITRQHKPNTFFRYLSISHTSSSSAQTQPQSHIPSSPSPSSVPISEAPPIKNPIDLSHAFKALVKDKNYDSILSLYNAYKDTPQMFDVVNYSYLVHILCGARYYKTAVSVYKDMLSKGINPTKHIYHTMIKVYFLLEDYEKCFALSNEMKIKNLDPDYYTVCTLIPLLLKSGQKDNSEKFLHQIEMSGIYIDGNIYHQFIMHYCSEENVDEALRIFKRMFVKNVIPLDHSYTKLISTCNKNDRLDDVLNLYESMLKNKIETDSVTYSVILLACSKFLPRYHTHIPNIWQRLIDKTSKKKTLPDRTPVEVMIVYSLYIRDFKKAAIFFNHLRSRRIVPNRSVYLKLLNYTPKGTVFYNIVAAEFKKYYTKAISEN